MITRNNLVCAFMILLVITSNISTIDEEIETSERDIPGRLELFDFHMENTNGLSEDSILLTGHDMPVILTLDIEAYRFIKHENVIGQSISEYDATHIITQTGVQDTNGKNTRLNYLETHTLSHCL